MTRRPRRSFLWLATVGGVAATAGCTSLLDDSDDGPADADDGEPNEEPTADAGQITGTRLSFEDASVGDERPPDPWRLRGDTGTHVVTTDHVAHGDLAFRTAGGGGFESMGIAVRADLTDVATVRLAAYVEAKNASAGDVKISLDGTNDGTHVYRSLDSARRSEDRMADVRADVAEYSGEHDLVLWVRGRENDATWDDVRFLDAADDRLPLADVLPGVGGEGTQTETDRSGDPASDAVFRDTFEDGEYADRWRVVSADDETIREEDGALFHRSPKRYNEGGTLRSRESFPAEGRIRIDYRLRFEASDFWGGGLALRFDDGVVNFKEQRWGRDQEFRVGVNGSEMEGRTTRVGPLLRRTDWTTYSAVVDFDAERVVGLERDGRTLDVDVDFSAIASDRFQVDIGIGRGHRMRYDEVVVR